MVLVSILFAILAIAGFVLTLQWLKVKITVTVPNQYEEMFVSLAEDYNNKLSFGTFDFVMDNSEMGEDGISDIMYEDEDEDESAQQYDNEVNKKNNNDLLDQLPHNIIPKTTTNNDIDNNDNDII